MRYLKIEKAVYQENLTVLLEFNDGNKISINFGEWIRKHPHPQHNRYLDEKKFKKFYLDEIGNIAWGKNRDLYFPIEDLHKGKL